MKKDSYLKNKTLSLKEEVRVALYDLLTKRNDYKRTYLTVIRTRVAELTGITNDEKEKILAALDKTFEKLNYKHPDKIYGEPIEDRGAEIVFSALGQEAPLEEKEKWNKENPDIRSRMEKILQNYLPDMEAKVAGLTSIDVTRKGVDKAYGIRQISKYVNTSLEEMLFVGNDFSREGNDEPVLKTGVLCFEVKGFGDTKKLIRYLL